MAQIYPDPIDQLRPGELVFPIRVSHVVTRNKKRKQDSGESPNFASASRDVPVQPVAEAISPAPTLAGVDTSPFPAFASEDVVLSERFEYVVEDGDIHGTILGNKQFQRCEDEPIHIPGAIQSFGFLIALEFGVMDQRRACIASENCAEMCSYSPLDLFRMDNAMDMFSDFHRNVFDKKIRYLQYQYHMNPGSHIAEPIVFQTSIRSQSGEEYPLICALHIVDRSPPLLVCEFERLAALQPYKEFDPELALYSLNSQESSTIRATSEMLELQRLVYSVQQDGGSTTETVNIMSNIQKQFSSCQNLQELLDCIVMVVQQLTAFHKVMVYQFDNYFNGKVAAEIVAADEDIARYRGLHFPAADIPPQARKLYQINRFRLLFDRDKPTARLVHCNQAGLGSVAPLDLTHSYLRAMSPVHIKYLENMQVRSTASISLDINGVLWGLIACHSYGPTGINIPFSVRTICYWIGLCASNCIENLASREKLETRVVFESISASHPPQECITASSADILKLFRANSGFIVINGEVRTLGKHEAYREAFLVLQFINLCKFEKVTLTENLANDYPDFVFAPILQTVAGFLFIPLSSSTDYIIFLRDHQRREVNWAGNPHKTETLSGSSLLQPRASFQKWTEVVSGTCREWSNLESKEYAQTVRVIYSKFIQIWRSNEVTVYNSRNKQLLLLNASHEARTPLNAIINYLEIALEKPLDDSTKEILQKSHSASISLVYAIEDLLSITKAKDERLPILESGFDIESIMSEALEPLAASAKNQNLEFYVNKLSGPPLLMRGDVQRLQQVITHLVSNAIQYTDSGSVTVNLDVLSQNEHHCLIKFEVSDTGVGISEQDLEEIFQDLEEVPFDYEVLSNKTGIDGAKDVKQNQGNSKLGLGLAIVARYTRLRSGQLLMKSEKSKGTTVSLLLPFPLATEQFHPSQIIGELLPTPPNDIVRSTETPVLDDAFSVASQPLSPMEQADSISPFSEQPERHSPFHQRSSSKSWTSVDDQEVPGQELVVVVADDNNINLQILQRRLENMGHDVLATRDGQQCFDIFEKKMDMVEFILMDIEMPILNGIFCTQMIRELEKKSFHQLSNVAKIYGRTPLFAVSARISASDYDEFVANGFDGWLTKPVNFHRLKMILSGAFSAEARAEGIYENDDFAAGGWFKISIDS